MPARPQCVHKTHAEEYAHAVAIHVVRLGTPRSPGERLRIGTVRRPPRGVPKARFSADNWYDTWLPELSPSAELVKFAQQSSGSTAAGRTRDWAAFVRRYRAEMSTPEATHLLDLLAALSRSAELAVGCYCADESRCHRSVLRQLLEERGAVVC
jgi:uncharacterized protein YeaO (DUF488 family)